MPKNCKSSAETANVPAIVQCTGVAYLGCAAAEQGVSRGKINHDRYGLEEREVGPGLTDNKIARCYISLAQSKLVVGRKEVPLDEAPEGHRPGNDPANVEIESRVVGKEIDIGIAAVLRRTLNRNCAHQKLSRVERAVEIGDKIGFNISADFHPRVSAEHRPGSRELV